MTTFVNNSLYFFVLFLAINFNGGPRIYGLIDMHALVPCNRKGGKFISFTCDISFRCQDAKNGKKYDYSFDEVDLLDKFSEVILDQTPVRDFGVNVDKHLVLIVGGETEGISQRAHKFAVENSGQLAFVPMFNGMDSLNVLSAASILMHHCQSHFLAESPSIVVDE